MKKVVTTEWTQKLMVLGEKQGSIRLNDLAEEMSLSPEDTLSFLRQIFPSGSGLEIYHKENDCWVDIKNDAIQYMLPLSPAEWIQLQDVLAITDHAHTPVMNSLRKKITDNGPVKVIMELLHELETWDEELSENQQLMVKEFEEAQANHFLLKIETHDKKIYNVFPCKVLHLEGQLALIAEDRQDHCLTVIPTKDIYSWEALETTSTPSVSVFEVEEFITAIRSMNEKETRLILKIHDPQSTNLFPDHHFLGKPCMITNPQGDLIWAAYVEPCEALYEWLISLGKKVEILDPVRFKEDYLAYCEEKLRKVA